MPLDGNGLCFDGRCLLGIYSFFSSHLSGAGYSPVQLAFLRNIVASVAMWGYLLIFRREILKINWKDLWMFIGTGTFSVVFFNIAYFMTIEQTTLSVAAIRSIRRRVL